MCIRDRPLRVIYDASMPKDLLKRVMNKLNLDKLDTVSVSSTHLDVYKRQV